MKKEFDSKMKKIGRMAARVLCLVLCASVAITMMPMPDYVYAGKNESEKKQESEKSDDDSRRQQEDQADKNTYNNGGRSFSVPSSLSSTGSATKEMLLIITNGITTPNKGEVEYFTVRYLDAMGCLRAITFDPEEAYNKAKNKATQSTTISYGNKTTRDMMSLNVSDTHEIYTPYATEIYSFSVYEDFKEFAGLSIKTKAKPASSAASMSGWTIEDVKVVQPDKIAGWINAGYYSSMDWIGYEGMNLAEAKQNCEFEYSGSMFKVMDVSSVNDNPTVSWINNNSWTAETYRNSNRNSLKTMLSPLTDNRSPLVYSEPTSKDAIYENSMSVDTYAVNLNLGDLAGGGIEAFNTEYSTMSLALAECLYADICYTTQSDAIKHVQYPIIANSMAWFLDSYKAQQNVELKAPDMISFAQQGESVPFYFSLPLLKKLNYITITYTPNANGATGRSSTESELRKFYCSRLNGTNPSLLTKVARQKINNQNAGRVIAETDDSIVTTEIVPDAINIAGIQFYEKIKVGDKANANQTNYLYLDVNNADFAVGKNVNPTLTASTKPASYYKAPVRSTGYCPGENVSINENILLVPLKDDGNTASMQGETFEEIADHEFIYDNSSSSNMSAEETNSYVNPYYNGGALNDKYLIEVSTSTPQISSTDGQAYVSVRYMNEKGKEVTTGKVAMSGIGSEYYGYWPGASVSVNGAKLANEGYAETDNMGYYRGMEAGQKYSFIVNLNNIGETEDGSPALKSITFSLANDADDWCIEDYQIYKIGSIGSRKTKYIGPVTYNKYLTNREYSRDVQAYPVFESADGMRELISTGGYVTFMLDGTKDADDNWGAIERNYDDVMNSMPLEYAKKNLNFTYPLKTYYVRVEVPRNSAAATLNDSCGSANYFYYQLVFENGKSGYVLANQQIEGDCFTAGDTMEFTIKTNYDYGDLTAINIVPDDSTDGLDHLDKLCINKISVIKGTTTGIKKQWVINQVGWIGLDYMDKGTEGTGTSDIVYHSEGELLKTYQIDYSTFIMSLEFRLSYGSCNEAFGEMEDANVTADLKYTMDNPVNEVEDAATLKNIQIVDRMYEYARKPQRTDSDENGVGTGKVISDSTFMLRSNTSDRFVLDMENFSRLDKMAFKFATASEAELRITALDVFILQSGGRLQPNDNNEYEMKYTQQPLALTSAMTGKVVHTPGNWQVISVMFEFEDNEIPEYVNEDTPIRIVDRVPASQNDTVNILVKVNYDPLNSSKNSDNPMSGGKEYTISANLGYRIATKTSTIISTNTLKAEANGTLFAIRGVAAPQISVINYLELSNKYAADYKCVVDGATVQQIRSGVVINTYTFDISQVLTNLPTKIDNVHEATTDERYGSKHMVYVMLDDQQNYESKQLVAPEGNRAIGNNVAVAFSYKSSKDATDAVYTTKSVYATDFGYTKVMPGQLLCFEMDEPYVREITELQIQPSGDLTLAIDKALIISSSNNKGEITTRSYSFAKAAKAGASMGIGKMKCTSSEFAGANTVQLVDIDFYTSNTASGADGGTPSADVTLTFNKGGVNSDQSSETFNNIQNHNVGSSPLAFSVSGEKQTVSLLASNLGEIRSLTAIPHNNDKTGAWTISKIVFTKHAYSEGGEALETKTITPNKTVYESNGGGAFNFSNIEVRLDITWPSGSSVTPKTVRSGDSEVKSYTVNVDEKITIKPTISGSLISGAGAGTVKLVELTDKASERDASTTLYTVGSDGTVTFKPTEAAGGKRYQLTVYSTELDTVKATVIFEVAPKNSAE